MQETRDQFGLFLGVGLICALLDIGLMHSLLQLGGHYVVATSVGFIVGLVANFILHTRITFRAQYAHRTLIRFLLVVFANYLLTLSCVALAALWWQQPIVGKLSSLPLVAGNGFLLSKYWVYK